MRTIDNMIFGIFIGLVFPLIAWLTEFLLNTNVYLTNRPAVPYFIAIALNLILIRIFLKRDAGKTLRGVMLITFVVMVIVLLKIHPLR